MTDRMRERPPGAVDFDADLAVLADSAVFYHRNREAAAAETTPEELVGKAFERTAAIADKAERGAKAKHVTACRKGCAWCCHQNVRVSAQTCQRAVESPGENRFEPLLDAIHGTGLASISLELEFAFLGSGPISGELTAMLAVALTDSTAETRWSRGENPFLRHNEFSTHLNSRWRRCWQRRGLDSQASPRGRRRNSGCPRRAHEVPERGDRRGRAAALIPGAARGA